MSCVPRCSFPYGHSVRPGQSSGSGDVQISTSCPRPHCLPIRRRVTAIVDFDPILLIPSQSPNIKQFGRGNLHPKIHTPQLLAQKSLPAPFARPTRQVARRGLFLSAIFRAPRNGRAMASRLNASNSDRSASYAFSRLPLVIS